jgi:hypothetical protein
MKINGPVNVIRLEGIIHDIKKIIYIYFDHHYPINKQTKCDGYLNYDIVTYLNKEFIKVDDKNIDFFMETSFNQESELLKNINYKDRYIDEINKFFISNIIIKNNKNLGTKINKNIRFHYVDIRESFKTQSFHKLFQSIKNIINENKNYKDYKKYIDTILDELDKLKNILKESDNKIIYKLKTKYKYPDIKDKLNILLNKLYVDIDILKINVKNIETIKDAEIIYLELIGVYSWLMDIYFLRRFLDKDYINHSIIYCGSGHSLRYIHFLIREFNFKITHAAYITKPIGLVNEILRNYESYDIANDNEIYRIFNSPDNIQCIDISSFPDNFS